jgi:hypothetical protein
VIYEYIKDKHGHRRGVIVATDRHNIGWSLCNLKQGDKFDRRTGLDLAVRRAASDMLEPIPSSVKNPFKRMKKRAKRYYKI